MRPGILSLLLLLFALPTQAQENNVYRLHKVGDIATLTGGLGLALLAHGRERLQPGLTQAELDLLDPLNVSRFDRSTTANWSPKASRASDVLLVSSGFLALGTMLGNKKIRNEWAAAAVMSVETFLLIDFLTFNTKVIVDRRRPFAYGILAPLSRRMDSGTRQSFFSGHASYSAAAAFLGAKMYHDTHRDSPWRIAAWGGAGLISGSVAWLRVTAGKHFRSDVIVGFLVGAATGILVPEIHRIRSRKDGSARIFHWETGPARGIQGWRIGCRF